MYNGIKILLLEFEKRSQKQPKTTKKKSFSDIFQFSRKPRTTQTKIFTAILQYMGDLCVQ